MQNEIVICMTPYLKKFKYWYWVPHKGLTACDYDAKKYDFSKDWIVLKLESCYAR